MKKSLKRVIAVLCAIAMVVTSVTVYNAQTAKASATATGNSKVYTVTDGSNDGFTGFTCNGVEIQDETNGFIGLAWGVEVDPASVKVSINGTEVTTYNGVAYGVFVAYSQFKDLADGEYPIVVTATTVEGEKAVTANATLKIQDQGETEPAVIDPSAVKWDDISWLGNGTTDQANADRFKAYISPANPKKLEAVNIQAKNDVNAVYMPNNDSPAQKIEVNGVDITGDCIIDGAQTFIPVTVLTKKYNTVVITTVNSNVLSAFIFNIAGEGSDTPVEPDTTKAPVESDTTEAPVEPDTTVDPVQTTAAPTEIVLDQELAAPENDNNYQVGGYNVYVGQWNGSTAVAGVDATNKDHIKIQQKTCANWDPWGIQVAKKVTGLTPGETYTYTVEMNASPVDGNYKKTGDDTLYPLQAAQTVEIQVTANDTGAADFVIGLGGVGVTVVVEIANPVIKDSKGNVVTPKDPDDTTAPVEQDTTAPVESDTTATPDVTTPNVTDAPTTEAPTTAPKATTTKKALAKTKVKSASKKKAAKKVKITFKKVKGAKKYKVQIATTKKFKKVLVKKTVKKVKVTISSKKFKNKKKLYVRVRAVGAKKWSKVKKIKIKK